MNTLWAPKSELNSVHLGSPCVTAADQSGGAGIPLLLIFCCVLFEPNLPFESAECISVFLLNRCKGRAAFFNLPGHAGPPPLASMENRLMAVASELDEFGNPWIRQRSALGKTGQMARSATIGEGVFP
jgi:hypothetical protein